MSWQPLHKIYLEKSAFKNVDPLARHTINEDVQIYKGEENGYELMGVVDDKDYRKINNIIKKEGQDSIERLVEQSGFTTQLRYIKNFFNDFDINYGEVEILSNIKSKSNFITSQLNGSQGEFSLHQLIYPVIKNILANDSEEDVASFYNSLFVKSFAEGTVSVGDGELILSLLTELYKGDVGDLKSPSGLDIELKVGMGRIISARGGGFLNDFRTLEELAKKPDLSIEDFADAKFTGDLMKKAFTDKNILTKFLTVDDKNLNKRMQHFAGIALNEYGGHGFDYLLYVYQKGFTRKSGSVMDNSTFDAARYLDVRSYDNIIKAINSNFISFKYDGDGIYIGYPGSNTNAKFKKDLKLS
jgi:hypothetical protein|tara:strand:- start:3020 stop:4090 length:1071 start_codon:yes stop_codon:yes gene_type:complete